MGGPIMQRVCNDVYVNCMNYNCRASVFVLHFTQCDKYICDMTSYGCFCMHESLIIPVIFITKFKKTLLDSLILIADSSNLLL